MWMMNETDQVRLEYIWNNINLIYRNVLVISKVAKFKDITILSDDNYLVFTLEKEFSLINPPRFYLHNTNFHNLNDIIKVLNPIFRDFKIQMIDL